MTELDKYKKGIERFKETGNKIELKILISADRFNNIVELNSGIHEVLQYLREYLTEHPDEELIALLKDSARRMPLEKDFVLSEYINVLSNFIISLDECEELIELNSQKSVKQYSFSNMKIRDWINESKDFGNIYKILNYNSQYEELNKNLYNLLYNLVKDEVKQGFLFYSLNKNSKWKNFNAIKYANLVKKAN